MENFEMKKLTATFATIVHRLLPKLMAETQLRDESVHIGDRLATLSFEMKEPASPDEIMDDFDDDDNLVVLYDVYPRRDSYDARNVCAFYIPNGLAMFKVNASADEDGLCRSIDLTLFLSLDDMCQFIIDERELVLHSARVLYMAPLSKVEAAFPFFPSPDEASALNENEEEIS